MRGAPTKIDRRYAGSKVRLAFESLRFCIGIARLFLLMFRRHPD
jgi:hypothetical protein